MNLSLIDDVVDWPALLRWHWLAKAGLLAACLLVFPLAGYAVRGSAGMTDIDRAQARNAQLHEQWRVESARVEELEASQAKNAGLEAELEHRRHQLFDGDGLASLLQSLARLGAGLSFEQVEVLEAEVRSHHVQLPLQVQVSGEFRLLQRFLAGLGELDALVTLHELQLAVVDEWVTDVLRLQLRLQAYRAVEAQGMAEPQALLSSLSRNPFEPVEPLSVGSGLGALEQARMVGHLSDRRGHAALVLWGAQVHLLREGDPLGAGRVGAVSEKRMELLDTRDGAAGIPRVLTLLPLARE